MPQFETWLRSDLKKPVGVQALRGAMFSADNAGNRIGVEVLDNGQPAVLTGSIMGYAIRADGETVVITGVLEDNRPYIVLPAAAYAVVGPLDIVIKNVVPGVSVTTLAACRVSVQRSATDAMIDPGHLIPSLEELLAQIDAMEAAEAAASRAADTADAAAGRAENIASKLESLDAAAETLETGAAATAQVTEAEGHYRLLLGLPRGEAGEPARVTATAVHYQNSESASAVPTGTWLAARPNTPQGQCLWTRTTLTWNDGQTTALYTAARQGVDGKGSVSSINGISPDASGNVTLDVSMPEAIDTAEIDAIIAQ